MKPVRLRFNRYSGGSLDTLSRETNGLPAILCTRPGRYGNPFRIEDVLKIRPDASPAEAARIVVAAHKSWLRGQKHWFHSGELPRVPDLEPLRGHNLACTCPTDRHCHVDNLLEEDIENPVTRWKQNFIRIPLDPWQPVAFRRNETRARNRAIGTA